MFRTMSMIRLLALASPVLLLAAPAFSASSEWYQVEGGAIRFVTAGEPGPDGLVRGALQIDLAPGWKTYWLDPGSSGVPPQVSVDVQDKNAEVEVGFPVPQRFDDGYAQWAGYEEPVALALTFRLPEGVANAQDVTAHTFLGVCETICIPVQAELTLSLGDNADAAEEAAIVDAAFAALPAPAEDNLGVDLVSTDDKAIVIDAKLPEGVSALDLFVAGNENLSLEAPELVSAGGGTSPRFRVPVAFRTPGAEPERLRYTLQTSAGAFSGELSLR